MARTGLRPLLRTRIHLDGELSRPEEAQPLAIAIGELSTAGLRFECDRATALRLLPPGRRAPGLVTGVKVRVRFQLPGLQKPVEIPCKLGICRREAQDRYCFECIFDPREHIQQQRIESFLKRKAGAPLDGVQSAVEQGPGRRPNVA